MTNVTGPRDVPFDLASQPQAAQQLVALIEAALAAPWSTDGDLQSRRVEILWSAFGAAGGFSQLKRTIAEQVVDFYVRVVGWPSVQIHRNPTYTNSTKFTIEFNR